MHCQEEKRSRRRIDVFSIFDEERLCVFCGGKVVDSARLSVALSQIESDYDKLIVEWFETGITNDEEAAKIGRGDALWACVSLLRIKGLDLADRCAKEIEKIDKRLSKTSPSSSSSSSKFREAQAERIETRLRTLTYWPYPTRDALRGAVADLDESETNDAIEKEENPTEKTWMLMEMATSRTNTATAVTGIDDTSNLRSFLVSVLLVLRKREKDIRNAMTMYRITKLDI